MDQEKVLNSTEPGVTERAAKLDLARLVREWIDQEALTVRGCAARLRADGLAELSDQAVLALYVGSPR